MEVEHLIPAALGNSYFRSSTSPGTEQGSVGAVGPLESKKRRLRELRLLRHYIEHTSLSLGVSTDPADTDLWQKITPTLALSHDALLYSMHSLTALHLARTGPYDPDATEASREYLDLAVREHYNDVSHLNDGNANAVCLTACLIRLHAFATLQDRPIDPYTPPMQWLQITSGAGKILWAAGNAKEDDETSIALQLASRVPIVMDEEAVLGESNRQGLLHLLRRSGTDLAFEAWDTDIQEAYSSALSLVGGIQIAITAHESQVLVFRRLMVFPIMAQKRFIELVEERQPRALVILAHFFAMLGRYRHLWWIAEAGQREIRGIHTTLSDEWRDVMSLSLQSMEENFLLVS